MRILIVKHGALGDVVRTSYFARALRRRFGEGLRLSWLTAPESVPLLRFNPWIDDIWTSFAEARVFSFDRIFSLDDELDVLDDVAQLKTSEITGALLRNGRPTYTDDAAGWFDMGLLSRFGKARADELKKLNTRGHAEIHCDLFGVASVEPVFYGNPHLNEWAATSFRPYQSLIGINPFAGGRWPSKELRLPELIRLIDALLAGHGPFGQGCAVVLFGAGNDRDRNLEIAATRSRLPLLVPNTNDSVLRMAALIGRLDLLITSDSLAMHLGIAQGVKSVAFFAPTSAAEIDGFGLLAKVTSTSPDYCSYSKHADNSSITADRLIQAAHFLAETGERRARAKA